MLLLIFTHVGCVYRDEHVKKMSVDLAQHEHAQCLFVDQQVEESLTNAYRSRSRDTLVEFEGVDRLLARIDVAHQRIGQATKGKWWAL